MLWQPCRCRSSMIAASPAASTSSPWPSLDVSQFWQKTHLRLHHEKKIVPEPFHPRRQSSSPKWANQVDTRALRPTLQTAVSSASRSTWQSRGHTRHDDNAATAASARRASSPEAWVSRYAGQLTAKACRRQGQLASSRRRSKVEGRRSEAGSQARVERRRSGSGSGTFNVRRSTFNGNLADRHLERETARGRRRVAVDDDVVGAGAGDGGACQLARPR